METVPLRGDAHRLVAVFHSPKRTFAEIGKTPSIGVVLAAMWLLFAAGLVFTLIATGQAPFSSRGPGAWLIAPLIVAVARPFIASAVYSFVFTWFGAEVRYRVVLSVTLHAMWVSIVVGTVVVPLLAQQFLDRPAFLVPDYLAVPGGMDERTVLNLARILNPLEIGRLVLTGLGFAIALRVAPWVCFGIVFAGWLGSHALTLVRLLLL